MTAHASYIRMTPDHRRAALIEASLSCIAEGGIAAFTVDRICRRASVSRGLIAHHFGSMNALLAAVYAHIYAASVPAITDLPAGSTPILALLDHMLSPAAFNRQSLNIWLTLWAEISNRPELREVHRAQYLTYHQMVTTTLSRSAPALTTPDTLARALICLLDGLGLQHCIDPASMPAEAARQICLDLLTPHTGPLT